jgi:glucose-6-phosphate 1-dehydrogenase
MDPHVIVLFGATGDLARRKLWPGMFHLYKAGLLPEEFRIIGSGRREPDDFAALVAKAIGEDPGEFAQRISFDARTLLYMSIPPSAMQAMVGMLGRDGLAGERTRIVLEKPFGHDVESAKALNAALHEHFDEDQVFRIDHFLGKEAAQDVLALRFANGLFEPIWNREHVASVQIDIPEKLGLEGRASFYEETGAFKDMVVTHLSQIMGFVAMEAPESLDAEHLRDAKAQAFRDLRPFTADSAVYGQFEGYRDEDGVKRDSRTETFVALRAELDNDRWRGVPFLLRTGKAMAEGRRVITLSFKDPEKQLFGADGRPDELVIELTDDPRIAVELRVKKPGPTLDVAHAWLELDVERSVGGHGLEAYERLLLDVMHGDHLLFTRADEVELLWERAAPLQADPPAPLPYAKGSWGPDAAAALAAAAGGWRLG